jgi:hypothetical protein
MFLGDITGKYNLSPIFFQAIVDTIWNRTFERQGREERKEIEKK